jgi:hypothetical protein
MAKKYRSRAQRQADAFARATKLKDLMKDEPCRQDTQICHPALGECLRCNAAVGPDFIAVAEIKSEKDTLKRLHRQLYVASQVADECWLAIHPKHEAALDVLKKSGDTGEVGFKFMRGFGTTKVFWDRDERFLTPAPYTSYVPEPWPDPRRRFQMLWAIEMTRELAPLGGGHGNMGQKSRRAVEWFTGGDLRRAVCRQLRQRPFPRADPIIPFGDALL